MLDGGLLLLVLAALAIGWWLGRRSGTGKKSVALEKLPNSYIQSLTFLISEQPDQAIDTLLEVFKVNETTFDTHIALGNMLRRRGELERAIRIHQNLISRPDLMAAQHETAQFELAKDYLQSGLLDRAEALFSGTGE